MWVLLILTSCAVNQARAIILHQDIGPIFIHAKAKGPPLEEYLPLDPKDTAATESILAYFKELKPKLGAVVVNSSKDVHHFKMSEISADVYLKLYNIHLKGLKHAVFNSLVIRTKNGRVDFNTSVPFLTIACTVFLNGVIDEHNTFAIFGNLSAAIEDINISGTVNIKEKELPTILRSTPATAFQIEDADVKISINNTMLQLKIIEELQAFKMTLSLFMNKHIDDIIKSVTSAVLLILNQRLAKIQPGSIKYLLQRQVAPPSVPLRFGPYLGRPKPNRYRYNNWY